MRSWTGQLVDYLPWINYYLATSNSPGSRCLVLSAPIQDQAVSEWNCRKCQNQRDQSKSSLATFVSWGSYLGPEGVLIVAGSLLCAALHPWPYCSYHAANDITDGSLSSSFIGIPMRSFGLGISCQPECALAWAGLQEHANDRCLPTTVAAALAISVCWWISSRRGNFGLADSRPWIWLHPSFLASFDPYWASFLVD